VIEVDGRVLDQRPLDKDIITLGRSSSNDVRVASQQVSGQHAVIMRQNGTWKIVDKGSTNGLTYNGSRTPEHTLKKGDSISIGKGVVLRYMEY
jgi:pSer/pThr/pTyr-binding forkhead associated (FHA) protein